MAFAHPGIGTGAGRPMLGWRGGSIAYDSLPTVTNYDSRRFSVANGSNREPTSRVDADGKLANSVQEAWS
eukprot:4952866-Amphidinium_carterae.1